MNAFHYLLVALAVAAVLFFVGGLCKMAYDSLIMGKNLKKQIKLNQPTEEKIEELV
jgi:hypothetical protein